MAVKQTLDVVGVREEMVEWVGEEMEKQVQQTWN